MRRTGPLSTPGRGGDGHLHSVRFGDEGTRITFHFCPTCGSTVYYYLEGLEAFIAIPVGAFADPTFPTPGVSVYEARMHSWVVPPSSAEHMP
ncbi:MAG: GFA family protein [Usitatibacteraceae bacterium]